MKVFDYINRIQRIHQAINNGKTGTPSEFAATLNISVSRLFRIIEELKLLGAPIIYDRSLRTYRYESSFEISFSVYIGTPRRN